MDIAYLYLTEDQRTCICLYYYSISQTDPNAAHLYQASKAPQSPQTPSRKLAELVERSAVASTLLYRLKRQY